MIAVDEEGAEAAAVTTVSISIRGATTLPQPIQFVVDRPFLIVLRDERTGADLFIGRIARPEVAR
jgi:serpin B